MLPVIVTPAAQAAILTLADRIALFNRKRAERFVEEIEDACSGLKEYPLRFSLVPRYEHVGIRRRVVGDYLVLYRVLQNRIEVIHVVHGATDYATILFPEH